MKALVSNKKGQRPSYAVSIILLMTIIFMLIYLIMVYPWERAELLGFNWTEGEESPLGPGTEIIYSSGEVALVGRGTTRGTDVFTFALNDMSVSYPPVPKTLDTIDELALQATFLSRGTQTFYANNLNLDSTKELQIVLNITEVKGTPTLLVFRNESLVFEKTAEPGLLIVKISQSRLQENNPIIIQLKHRGTFWETQSIDASMELVQIYYDPIKVNSLPQTFWLSAETPQGDNMYITFNATKAVTDGDLILMINDQAVWSGQPEEGKITTIQVPMSDSNIAFGEYNTFAFAVDKGGEYEVKKASLKFVAEASPVSTKIYTFDIPKEDLAANRTIKLAIQVDKILTPGYIHFKIVPYTTTYYFSSSELASGAWSFYDIPHVFLKEFGNKIVVSSPDGRYQISGFLIVLA